MVSLYRTPEEEFLRKVNGSVRSNPEQWRQVEDTVYKRETEEYRTTLELLEGGHTSVFVTEGKRIVLRTVVEKNLIEPLQRYSARRLEEARASKLQSIADLL